MKVGFKKFKTLKMKAKKIQITPSILSADFGQLNEDIRSIEKFSDGIHVDVMDGHFVPNLTFGAPVLRSLKTKLPRHCHLMVEHPERYFEDFVKAKAASIIVHQETCKHLHRSIQEIKSYGILAGVSINPATPVWTLEDILDEVDVVLVMSVNPGFGGQEFIPSALEKISLLREMAPDLDIAVDGGINDETAPQVISAGANILISGSYVFQAKNRQKAIERLRLSA